MPHASRRSKKSNIHVGSIPGSLHVDPLAPQPVLQLMRYSSADCHEETPSAVDELGRSKGSPQEIMWLNVDGLGDSTTLQALASRFQLHQLAMEDAVNVGQRAKAEQYEHHLYCVVRMLTLNSQGVLDNEQLSLFLLPEGVITLQERAGDPLEPLRRRIRQGKGRIRNEGADYLLYAILDCIVDHYFPVVEHYATQLEELESAILARPQPEQREQLHALKQDLRSVRKAIWPLREAIQSIMRRDGEGPMSKTTLVYMRDLYDHIMQLIELVDIAREQCTDLSNLYMSALSNQMNAVMKVLSLIGTIFIPLTFLAGIYGMNFKHMPELGFKYGYPLLLGIMAMLGLTFFTIFKKKRWL